MKISFIGCKDTPVALFKDLAAVLSKKISGLSLDERFAPVIGDIPFIASESAVESDFIIVFALLDEPTDIPLIKEKLIDVEIKTDTRILKLIDEDDFTGLDEGEYNDKKAALVEEIAQTVVDILFNEIAFEPKDIDFAL